MSPIIVSIQTNHPEGKIFLAQLLKEFSKVLSIRKVSSVYRLTEQEGLCLALSADTEISARDLHEYLQKREENYRSQVLRRNIDLTLLLFGNQTQMSRDLTLPHPELHERAEYLIPATEVEPEVLHPVLEETLLDLSRRHSRRNWGEFLSQGQELLDF